LAEVGQHGKAGGVVLEQDLFESLGVVVEGVVWLKSTEHLAMISAKVLKPLEISRIRRKRLSSSLGMGVSFSER